LADEKKEPWLNYLALTTVILAVCATFSTFKGGGFSTKRILNQSQATDVWSQFQSKSIKGYQYKTTSDLMELRLVELTEKDPKKVAEAYRKKVDEYTEEMTRYKKEREQLSVEANKFVAERDVAESRGGILGKAVIYLQIAILLCSIAALMKKKPLWVLGSVVGSVGVLYFLNGFFTLPWLRFLH